MTVLDRCYQLALWCAFQGLRAWWFIRRPNQHGALAMIWFEDRVLLVRNSYQPRWSAPGGSVERSESSRDAVVREIGEEIGIQVSGAEFRFVRDVEFKFRYRHDRVSLFEWHPSVMPSIKVDHREIVGAQWFPLDQASRLPLPPHLADYFARLTGSGNCPGPRGAG
ncbi:NUDIX domain-containing protein [Methylobacterium sp. A54F]